MDEFQEVIFVAEWKRLTTMKQKNDLIKEVFSMLEPSITTYIGKVHIERSADVVSVKRCATFLRIALAEFQSNNLAVYASAIVDAITKELKC